MQVTVKLATREGAAHISGILAGFTLLAKRGELTLRVLDAAGQPHCPGGAAGNGNQRPHGGVRPDGRLLLQ